MKRCRINSLCFDFTLSKVCCAPHTNYLQLRATSHDVDNGSKGALKKKRKKEKKWNISTTKTVNMRKMYFPKHTEGQHLREPPAAFINRRGEYIQIISIYSRPAAASCGNRAMHEIRMGVKNMSSQSDSALAWLLVSDRLVWVFFWNWLSPGIFTQQQEFTQCAVKIKPTNNNNDNNNKKPSSKHQCWRCLVGRPEEKSQTGWGWQKELQ